MPKKIYLGHHHVDLEGPGCPLNRVLVEIGFLDGVFAILISHMIPFWNPQDQGNVLGAYLGIMLTIRMIKKLKNVIYVGYNM